MELRRCERARRTVCTYVGYRGGRSAWWIYGDAGDRFDGISPTELRRSLRAHAAGARLLLSSCQFADYPFVARLPRFDRSAE